MNTKIKTNNYILPLALQLKERLENEDIELCVSILSDYEKQLLKIELLRQKIEVKNPADYQVNRKIYKIIAVIMDKTLINQRKEKNAQNKPFQTRTNLSSNY